MIKIHGRERRQCRSRTNSRENGTTIIIICKRDYYDSPAGRIRVRVNVCVSETRLENPILCCNVMKIRTGGGEKTKY